MIPIPAGLASSLADRYRIERELGHGGMATVYLAEDLRHHRQVAIKVLRPELAAVIGAERFLTEIRTTAALQHPHILPLFDSGIASSPIAESPNRPIAEFLFYVMPFVEGESLRDRLTREKQLPVADAVRIAGEVASALDYAHRHGVIHRDIKPENILLHDGRALVADFGIALAASKAGGTRMTETGMSLGTPHYMSPEQAMGEREITGRSDVYALGCVTYEMLVGEPPFTGPTAQAIVAKVMTAEPASLTGQRRSVPPAVEAAVLGALEKLPADRFATAAEFAAGLTTDRPATRRLGGPGAHTHAAESPSRRAGLYVALALVALLAAWGWLRPAPAAPLPSKLAILVSGLGGSGGPAAQRQLAIARDGSELVYVAVGSDGVNRLVRHSLDSEQGAIIPNSSGLAAPLLAPDGSAVFGTQWAPTGAFRIRGDGGDRTPLPAGFTTTGYADFAPDGSIWFGGGFYAEGARSGVFQLLGNDSIIAHFAGQHQDLQLQALLPDGRRALMVRSGTTAITGPIVLLDLRTGETTTVLDRPLLEAKYTSGFLVTVALDGTLQAVPFDQKRGRVTGAAITIGTGVSVTGTGVGQVAVAENGTVAYIPEEPRSLVFVDRAGASRVAVTERHSFHAPMFSPDGTRLSTDYISGDGRDVWILSLAQGTLTRATFDRDGHDATWAPDGRFITYASSRGGALGIFRTRPGSATGAESLFVSEKLLYTGLPLPDGSGFLTVANGLNGSSSNDLALLGNGGRGPLTAVVASPFSEVYPSLSPDGKWVAFVSDQSGRQEVYVRPLAGDGDQVQVSAGGATEPLWSRDGRELIYRTTTGEDTRLVSALFRTSPAFEILSRQPLFSMADIVGTNPHTNYDLSPDGRTFAMVRRSPATRIMVIQHLPELVRRLQGSGTAN